MEELEKIKAEFQKSLDNAGLALKSKAENAEQKAVEAMDKAKSLIEKMEANEKATNEEIEQLRKDFNELASKKAEAKEVPHFKTWEKAFAEAYEAQKDAVAQTIKKQKEPLVFELKAAATVGLNNTIEAVGSESHYTITQNTGIISAIRKRITTYLNRVSVGSLAMEKPYGMWIEELDEQGNPIFIGEGDPKTQISVRYEEREKKAKKIAVYSKVTTEMLKYLPQLISFLQNNMMRRVDLATEQQLINGDDTGDNLAGVLSYATDFTGGDMAGTVTDVNDWDVILGAISQARKAFGIVNGFFIKGGKLDAMLANKDQDGQYIRPEGVLIDAQGNISAWGVPLFRTEATLTYGGDTYDFFGGDLSVINVGFTGNMTIQIGLDGNDFTNNKKTILVEQELVQFVSANDTQVLVKGDFDSAKALLAVTT